MIKIYYLYLIFILIISCNQSNIYSNYYNFEDKIWHSDSSIVFDFNSRNEELLNFNLFLSYSNEYPFQNIYSSYSLLDSEKNIVKSDMIELQLFDKKYGYPLGDGIFKNFTVDTLIIKSLKIKKNAEYTLLVKHSMRDDKLPGISRLALVVEK
tara:strand:- start:37296 stop:37754 length:459 start_codon:yes stop_codon:yes gene_type:complete